MFLTSALLANFSAAPSLGLNLLIHGGLLAQREKPASIYPIVITVGVLIAIAMFAVLFFFMVQYGKLWFQAYMSDADVKLVNLIRMHFTKVNPNVIVQAKVMAAQAKLNTSRVDGVSTQRLEAHYLAGGNVMNVIHAIIAAHRAQIPLDFDQAAAIDLAGRDVLDAVQTSVYPKVIDCPDPKRSGKTTLSAITKNGIELRVRARVTVRTNIEQLIGGATEDTIIARVGEAIISSIGSATSHFDVLENPDMITRVVLSRALDAQTAFEIVSIDIADIDVGENIGARLQRDQAEADTRVARAKAERRRAEAIAQEQQMKARVSENRSQLVLAEADVPKAMAEAFTAGRIGTTDSKLPMDGSA
ncbi:flotillin-like protein FloA [Allorhodopirellula heiligendammensis]|uniref:Flotillin-like protein FloA n=1 Tax=Allorhodopirellula heiligendammensis TaxID=2714739 RepID=A0A5C6C6I4_9BACT|nr:flotillin-like protein FloA [Allorhodopirellula heiligendammensis]TWU18399.1 SigmaW regulon antibacterial [Allorhodopirellula heiligendammensis]